MIKTKNKTTKKILFITLGLFYLSFLIISFFYEVSTILQLRTKSVGVNPSSNFIPFETILTYILNFNHYNLSTWLFNMLGNLLIFFPVGIIFPLIFNRINSYKHILYITISMSLVIEILQYRTSLGVFDIDDIILGVTGSLIGFHLYLKSIKK